VSSADRGAGGSTGSTEPRETSCHRKTESGREDLREPLFRASFHGRFEENLGELEDRCNAAQREGTAGDGAGGNWEAMKVVSLRGRSRYGHGTGMDSVEQRRGDAWRSRRRTPRRQEATGERVVKPSHGIVKAHLLVEGLGSAKRIASRSKRRPSVPKRNGFGQSSDTGTAVLFGHDFDRHQRARRAMLRRDAPTT
jgi:hypothetical protein